MTKQTKGSSGAQRKRQSVEDLTEQYSNRAAARTSTSSTEETKSQDFANIEANAFFQVMFDETTTPTEKKQSVAKLLAYTGSREDARANIDEFEEFKAFLQTERKNMARSIISLTDTDTFAELQAVYGEINDALLDFEDSMGPLTDIIDAVYSLRNSGVTLDVYEEIRRDRQAEADLEILRSDQKQQLESLEQSMGDLRRTNATLVNEKSFFGFGDTTKEAKNEMARNNVSLAEQQAKLDALTADIESTTKNGMPETEFAEFAAEKAKLRELLDISSDDHKERQETMVTKAIEFVDTTEERVGQVLKHFDGMNDQIERLGDANFQMRSVYAVLNDATDDAHVITESKRQELQSDMDGKGEIEKLQSAEGLRDLENHVTHLSKTDVDTTRVLAELTQAGSRVQAMKENNDQQVSNTRSLHTSGVAGVADQLSTVIQAVSSASLGEASEAAKISIRRMSDTTGTIAAKEAFRTALGMQGTNDDLSKALEDLTKFGDVVQATSNIRREALGDNRDLLEKMQRISEEVQADISTANAIAADVIAGHGGASAPANDDAPTVTRPSVFGLGA